MAKAEAPRRREPEGWSSYLLPTLLGEVRVWGGSKSWVLTGSVLPSMQTSTCSREHDRSHLSSDHETRSSQDLKMRPSWHWEVARLQGASGKMMGFLECLFMTHKVSSQLCSCPPSGAQLWNLHSTSFDNLFRLWDLGPGTQPWSWRPLFAMLTEYLQTFSSLQVFAGHSSWYTIQHQQPTVDMALLKEHSEQRGDSIGLLSIPRELHRKTQHRWPSIWDKHVRFLKWLSTFCQADETEKLGMKALSSTSKKSVPDQPASIHWIHSGLN